MQMYMLIFYDKKKFLFGNNGKVNGKANMRYADFRQQFKLIK